VQQLSWSDDMCLDGHGELPPDSLVAACRISLRNTWTTPLRTCSPRRA